jgi:hypothetical protein
MIWIAPSEKDHDNEALEKRLQDRFWGDLRDRQLYMAGQGFGGVAKGEQAPGIR